MALEAQPVDYTDVIVGLGVGRPLEVCTRLDEDASDVVFNMCNLGDFMFRVLAMDEGEVAGPPVRIVGSGERSDEIDSKHVFVTGRKLFVAEDFRRPANGVYSLGMLRYVNTSLPALSLAVRKQAFQLEED